MKVLDIKKIYMLLVKKALEDGVISRDESKILAAANHLLEELKKQFEVAGEDGVITEEEREELQATHRQLSANVHKVAEEDLLITEEEEVLMNTLSELIERELNRSVDVRKTFTAIVHQ